MRDLLFALTQGGELAAGSSREVLRGLRRGERRGDPEETIIDIRLLAAALFAARGMDPERCAMQFGDRTARWCSRRAGGAAYAASACNFTPSALATLSTVAKLGLPSALSAR